MMQLPTNTEIQILSGWRAPESVTIYSPYIEPSSADNNPNRIQLKNLLKEAHRLLAAKRLGEREIDKILKPAKDLIDGDEFSTSSKRGLALFLNLDLFYYYHLPPTDMKPYVIVDKKFKTGPLAKLLNGNLHYYVLVLSFNGVQLFKGDRYNLKKLKFQKKPVGMMEDLNIDELPNERQLHVVAALDTGRKSKRYHGQYNETETNKDLLTQYFRHIDHRLRSYIKNKRAPLIIAGVDYLLPIYQQVNTYPHLFDKEIIGSIEHLSLDQIREKACTVLDNSQISK